MKVIKFSSLGYWLVSITTPSSKTLTRIGLTAVAVASAVFIAGCGGGGGESPSFGGTPPVVVPPVVTPPVAPPVTPPVLVKKGVLTLATCAVELDKTSCPANATATGLENVSTTVFLVTGGASVAGPGPVAVPLSLGTSTVTLNGDGQKLDEKTVTIACATGLNQQNNTCVAPPKVYRYDRVTVMSFAGYPASASPDKLPVLAKNDTGYTEGGFPVSQCLTSTEPQPDGVYLVLCSIASLRGDLMPISWLITENRLVKWEGALPAGLEYSKNTNGTWNLGAKWKGCMSAYCPTGPWGTPPVPESEVPMVSWAPLKEGGFLYSANDALWVRSPEGVNTLLRDYIGTQFPAGYTFGGIRWMNTISN